jgi:signal transduction histidine kinase
MTHSAFIRWVSRQLPQRVRTRMAILYAALFLAAGALLLALTYGLVASTLPTTTSLSKLTSTQQAKLALACNQAEQAARSKTSGPPKPIAVTRACQKLASEAANSATQNQRDRELHDLLLFSLLGLGVMTLASGLLGWIMAGRVLRPVSAITGAARRASERHLGERLALQGPRDELKELADTFDEMLDRLDVAFAAQRRFVANASHELRTPLTVMRTAIEVTLAKPNRSPQQLEAMAAKIRRSVDQAEKLVEALLTLAMSERDPATEEFVDLATATEDAVEAVEAEIESRHLQLTTDLRQAEVFGDRSLLERLVGNLVDNAVRHNLGGGSIDIRTGSSGEGAYIEVANSGGLIDEQLVESLFEPFWRLGERMNSSQGLGLGLPIVRSIAAAHGGVVIARPRTQGGLTMLVSLPNPGANRADTTPSGRN